MGASAMVLDVSNLEVEIALAQGTLRAVRGIDFTLGAGETLGIVGESGSGKSVTAMALVGLLPARARRKARSIRLGNTELLDADEDELAASVRGRRVAMIFQEPMTSLNPVYTIRRQMVEASMLYGRMSAAQAEARAIHLLQRVGLTGMSQFPHQLSGGQRQRVMIAMALMNEPELLIADEPTSALDVTIQAQILHLLADLQREFGMAMILISHDLGVVARVADRIAVMYAGKIVETGTAEQVLGDARHPYTFGLLKCVPDVAQSARRSALGSIPGVVPSMINFAGGCAFAPRCSRATATCRRDAPPRQGNGGEHVYFCFNPMPGDRDAAAHHDDPMPRRAADDRAAAPVLAAQEVSCGFDLRRGLFGRKARLEAVKAASLELRRGEITALVGESGCGKTTLSKIMLGAQAPDGGSVLLDSAPLDSWPVKVRARRIQPIFQDPYSSLNPRRTVGETIAQPLRVHRIGDRVSQERKTNEMMTLVGLPDRLFHSYPSQLSGGQRQRVAIARAMIMTPDILICDEPTSALDVSVQTQILNLLLRLRSELELTYLFITHSLAVVSHIADRVAVMYLGQIVELGAKDDIIERPRHPYTRALLDSVLTIDPAGGVPDVGNTGDIPNPLDAPGGCPFHPRCARAEARCQEAVPPAVTQGRLMVRCFHPL